MKKNKKVPIANMDSHENGEKQLLAAWVDDQFFQGAKDWST